jgi:hypothetical protein
VLIGHSDGKNIYLPGVFGEKISLDEVGKISRKEAPNRVVILIVCNGGKVNEDAQSFSEVIIKNKAAKSVLASPHLVDAGDVPQLLTDLLSGSQPIWQTLQSKGIFQIVRRKPKWVVDG